MTGSELKFVHIGFGYVICANRVVGVFPPGAEPTKRMMRVSKINETFIDMTKGHETKSYILMEDGSLIGVAFNAMTVYRRLNDDIKVKLAKVVKARKYVEEEIDDDIGDETEEINEEEEGKNNT